MPDALQPERPGPYQEIYRIYTYEDSYYDHYETICLKRIARVFPDGSEDDILPANTGDTGLTPGLGGSHMPQDN